MIDLKFTTTQNGDLIFSVDFGGVRKDYRFSISEVMSLPLPSIIALKFEFAYLRDMVMAELSRIEFSAKKRKVEAAKELTLTGKSKTAASEEAITDSVYETLVEKATTYEFYVATLNNIVKTLEDIYSYNMAISKSLQPHGYSSF